MKGVSGKGFFGALAHAVICLEGPHAGTRERAGWIARAAALDSPRNIALWINGRPLPPWEHNRLWADLVPCCALAWPVALFNSARAAEYSHPYARLIEVHGSPL